MPFIRLEAERQVEPAPPALRVSSLGCVVETPMFGALSEEGVKRVILTDARRTGAMVGIAPVGCGEQDTRVDDDHWESVDLE